MQIDKHYLAGCSCEQQLAEKHDGLNAKIEVSKHELPNRKRNKNNNLQQQSR